MLPKKKNLEEERAKHTVDSLYKDYVDDLFSYALGFGFDKQTAMDAIHDVFLQGMYPRKRSAGDTES